MKEIKKAKSSIDETAFTIRKNNEDDKEILNIDECINEIKKDFINHLGELPTSIHLVAENYSQDQELTYTVSICLNSLL